MRDYTSNELLALTPDRYLAHGYLDGNGALRPEIIGEYATAACTQLLAAECSPQELSLTVEAIVQVLPLQDQPTVPLRLADALEEALLVVSRAIQQGNNEGMVEWLIGCASAVQTEDDLQGFLQHMQVVNRQYALVAALLPSPSP